MNLRNTFNDYRRQGFSPANALSAAKTREEWNKLEVEEYVRLVFVADSEPYDDSFIDTWTEKSENTIEQYRRRLWADIERDGVWCLVGEFRTNLNDDYSWQSGDQICGLIGMDDAGYAPDIMNMTIEALNKALTISE